MDEEHLSDKLLAEETYANKAAAQCERRARAVAKPVAGVRSIIRTKKTTSRVLLISM